MANNEKTCWACKRILVGESKLGLCPDCLNKYGSPAAVGAVLGVVAGGRYLVKNREHVFNVILRGIDDLMDYTL